MLKRFLEGNSKPAGAIFMSGSGSNAERLLEFVKANPDCSWKPSVIVTDAPDKSRASAIAEKYNLPVIKHDILEFYRTRGEPKVTLKTENGRIIREEWTNKLREALRPYNINFGILAGFVPLSNITSDFPCLNVHPGDLTVEDENGRRVLVGLHTIPVELALMRGLTSLRSSVIIAQAYTGTGGEMDSGPILGISEPVKIDFKGYSLSELKDLFSKRPSNRPAGGYKDILENMASENQNLLKEDGDWIVFPPAVNDFAAGRFALDENNILNYLTDLGDWKKIKTVIYGKNSRKPVFI